MSEFDLIQEYFLPLAGPQGLGLLDDAAHFAAPNDMDIILSVDSFVEGIHFPQGKFDADIATRLLRVNLSDLAAKAASPRGYLLSLAWPKGRSLKQLKDFCRGMAQSQEKFGLKLWGGDTVATTGPVVASITIIGLAPTGQSPKRFGAKAGDDIWLSGYPGKGYLGLEFVEKRDDNALFNEYFYRPEPRLELKNILRTYASASLDISDGLIADIGKMANSSHLQAQVDIEKIFFPKMMTELIKETPKILIELITHGDDYEVAFTAHPDYRDDILANAKALDFEVSRIGRCRLGEGVEFCIDGSALKINKAGYDHFSKEKPDQ